MHTIYIYRQVAENTQTLEQIKSTAERTAALVKRQADAHVSLVHPHRYSHTHIYTHTYIYTHTHIYTHIHVCIHVHVHIHMYIHIHTHKHIHIHKIAAPG